MHYMHSDITDIDPCTVTEQTCQLFAVFDTNLIFKKTLEPSDNNHVALKTFSGRKKLFFPLNIYLYFSVNIIESTF